VDALRSQGVPAREAERRVEEILASPAYAAAAPHARRARQLETILSLQRRVARRGPDPEGVERVEGLSADAFFARYYATSTPVIIPDLIPSWPAAGWTMGTFRDRFGDATVKITDGREADPDYDMHAAVRTREVKMRELVDRIEATEASNDFYMVAQNRNLEDPALEGVFDDMRFDRGILDPTRRAGCTALWLGPAGTVTPLHHDTANILFCQIRGEKRVKLISPLEICLIEGATAMYAAVDPEVPDLSRHPWLADVLVREVVLGPGDALFIPVGWWHHVRALSASISLAFVGFARDVNDYDWYRPGAVP
jgi:hypothetical protein